MITLFKRYQRNRLRCIMRAHISLKRSGNLDRIARVKEALTEHRLNLTAQQFSPELMGRGIELGELVVRQYLLVRCGGLNLNQALLSALGKKEGRVVFNLPKEWRDILAQHGFKVAHVRSSILWQFYIGAVLFYGVLQIIIEILFGLFSLVNAKPVQNKRYAGFADLGLGNLPHHIDGIQSHDVISWYLQWSGRAAGIEVVRHTAQNAEIVRVDGVKVLPAKNMLPELDGVRAIFNYVLWGACASIIAIVDCLRGRWWHALLLNQAALAAKVRLLPEDLLAREYMFHNSGWIYRPLWTYEAEHRGATVIFYFYSTNCEGFKTTYGYSPIPYGWKAMSWPRYLVWDDYQADFVRKAVGNEASISVVGPIWFQGSAIEMPKVDQLNVAVFDVTPHRSSRYCTLGMDSEFYTPAVTNPFLEHVSNATRRHGVLMVWKRKRNIGRIAHPHYRRLADQLADDSHIVLVEPEISAARVIESSVAVISIPFTSTALIAREMGVPSVYYDPSGFLQLDDRAAHGIPILSGVEELDAWLSIQVSPEVSIAATAKD